jgi:ribosomal protein S18 acetylase RimI-like enzyme
MTQTSTNDGRMRSMSVGERGDAAALLGRAFGDNPGYVAMYPWLDDDARRAMVAQIKRGFVEAASRHQHASCVDVDGRLGGVALWCAPGHYPVSLRATLWQASRCVLTGPRGVVNLLRMDAEMKKRHPREPHYYLFVLGVEPTLQGRGVGSSVLAQLNAMGDATGLPWYLETDKPSSVKLYQRHGYDVVEEFTVASLNGVRVWTMLRRPR